MNRLMKNKAKAKVLIQKLVNCGLVERLDATADDDITVGKIRVAGTFKDKLFNEQTNTEPTVDDVKNAIERMKIIDDKVDLIVAARLMAHLMSIGEAK